MHDHFQRSVIIGLAIIVGALLVFTAAFYFVSQDLSYQADKITEARGYISERTRALESLASLKEDLAQADVYKQAMDRILVTQDQLIDFPRWLDSLARGRQVALSFSFAGDPVPSQGKAPGYVNFTFSVEGSFDELVAFMKDVEFQAPGFLVDLESVNLDMVGSDYKISSGGKVFFR